MTKKDIITILFNEHKELYEYCYKEHIAIEDEDEDSPEAMFIRGRFYEIQKLLKILKYKGD